MWVDGFLVSQNESCAFFEYDSHETMVRVTVVAANINPVLTAAIEGATPLGAAFFPLCLLISHLPKRSCCYFASTRV